MYTAFYAERRLSVALAALGICSLMAGPGVAQSLIYTDTATMNAGTVPPTPGTPPLSLVSLGGLSNIGVSYNNAIGSASVIGTEVRIAGAIPLVNAKPNGFLGTPVNIAGPNNGGQMVAVFGLQARVVDPAIPGNPFSSIDLTAGKLQIVELPTGQSFNQFNASTWGFQSDLSSPDPAISSLLAVYQVKKDPAFLPTGISHEPVSPGTPYVPAEPIANPGGDQTQVTSGNIAVDALLQSFFLFEEDPAFSQHFLDSTTDQIGDPTMSDLLEILQAINPNTVATNEALIFDGNQIIAGLTQAVLDATDQSILNAIAQFGFANVFATFGVGGPNSSDFFVTLPDPLVGGGDSIGEAGGRYFPGLQVTVLEPEPASMLAWAIIGLVGYFGVRRRHSKLASDDQKSRRHSCVPGPASM